MAYRPGLLLCVVVMFTWNAAMSFAWADAEPAVESDTLREVLVTGERPGPGLWRVSKDGHDLWILGTLEPLPKNMTWRSEAVLARIAGSQAVLAPPDAAPHIGFFRSIGLLPSVFRARRRPSGDTLEQSLPHDLYMRWLAVRVKYLNGSSADESLRPMLAAFNLYQKALDASALTEDSDVWDTVQKAARKSGVPIVPVTLDIAIDDPKGLVKSLGDIPLEREVGCFAAVIGRVETGLPAMRERANDWALGDVAGLAALSRPDDAVSCLGALDAVPALNQKLSLAKQRIRDLWIATAEAQIAKNQSSLAVLPLYHLLGDDDWLAELKAKGYAVKSP